MVYAIFPKATEIGQYAFSNASEILDISLPLVTTMGSAAFQNSNLHAAHLPKLLATSGNAFNNCSNLTTVDISSATFIDFGTFLILLALSNFQRLYRQQG